MKQLPSQWTWARVHELVDPSGPVMYGILQPGPDLEDGVPYIRPTEIVDDAVQLQALRRTSPTIAQQYRRSTLREGDVLLSIVGTIGKVAIIPRELNGANITQSSARVRPHPKAISSDYLAWCLRSPVLKEQYARAMLGTGVPRLNIGDVRELEVPLPPPEEQRRIVAKLDSLMERSRRAKEALDAIPPLLERYRQSMLAAAFRGDFTVEWRADHTDVEPASGLLERIHAERQRRWEDAEQAKMREKGKLPTDERWKASYKEPAAPDPDGLFGLPPGWEWATVDTCLAGIETGASFKCEERPPQGDEVGVVKVSAVTWGEFQEAESKTCLKSERVDPSLFINEGDFLFSRANTIHLVGACVIAGPIERKLMLSDKILRFRLVGLAPEWLLYVLRSPWGRREIERLASGNQESMRNIGQDRIRQIRVPIAPEEEMRVVLKRLEQASRAESALGEHVDDASREVTALTRSLLTRAFRGELVPQDPSDEPAALLLDRLRAERSAATSSPTARTSRTRVKPEQPSLPLASSRTSRRSR